MSSDNQSGRQYKVIERDWRSLVATMEEERHGLEKTGNCLEKIGSGGLRIMPKINLALIPC
jgi:hypothetical protein